jgi:hypothetical protein
MLQTGDIVFFKASDTFISRLIAKLTKSEYTHVGLMVSGKMMIEANRFIKTRVVPFQFDPELHQVYRLEKLDGLTKAVINHRAMLYKDYSYDYGQIIGWLLRSIFRLKRDNLFNRANALICSELIDYVYYYSGIKREETYTLGDVTPVQLLEVYDLLPVDF